jgi:hypothetical protein
LEWCTARHQQLEMLCKVSFGNIRHTQLAASACIAKLPLVASIGHANSLAVAAHTPNDWLLAENEVRYAIWEALQCSRSSITSQHIDQVLKQCAEGSPPCTACSLCPWPAPSDDRGRLVKATRLKGIKDFKASQFGLHPIALDVWGHFVFLHLQGGRPPAADVELQSTTPDVAAWLGRLWDKPLTRGYNGPSQRARQVDSRYCIASQAVKAANTGVV